MRIENCNDNLKERSFRTIRNMALIIHNGNTPLDRALISLSRDSTQRRRYLQARWQKACAPCSCQVATAAVFDLEFWWSRRLQTSLGRAMSSLDKK